MSRAVLLVDQDQATQMRYKALLEADGYEVLIASDSRTALNMLQEKNVDLLCLRFSKPTDQAMACLTEIRTLTRNLKVIISTDFPVCYFDFRTWLADACLTPAPDLSDLRNKIRELLPDREDLADRLN